MQSVCARVHGRLVQHVVQAPVGVAEAAVAGASGVVVILSAGAPADDGVGVALRSAERRHYGKPLVLVHDPASGPFPAYAQMPQDVSAFGSKALTWLAPYGDLIAGMVNERLGAAAAEPPDPAEDAPPHLAAEGMYLRLFLSHRQLSGRAAE